MNPEFLERVFKDLGLALRQWKFYANEYEAERDIEWDQDIEAKWYRDARDTYEELERRM